MCRRIAMLIFMALLATINVADGQSLSVTDLRCEYRTNPLGIDLEQPRLSWILKSE